MGAWETFGWGCLGGFIAYVLVFVLPEAQHMAETGAFRVEWGAKRALGLLVVMVIYVALAGVMAVVVGGADKPGEAIVYGMGWEAIAKGLPSAGTAVVARRPTRQSN